MKNAARNYEPAPAARGSGHEPSVILTLDHARRVYEQSSNKLDLATLVKAFEGAPDCADVSGAMPKPRKLK